MYPCNFGLSNQDVRLSLTQVPQRITMWGDLISHEINYAAMVAIAGCPQALVAMPQHNHQPGLT